VVWEERRGAWILFNHHRDGSSMTCLSPFNAADGRDVIPRIWNWIGWGTSVRNLVGLSPRVSEWVR
jgi:hypothetical protein